MMRTMHVQCVCWDCWRRFPSRSYVGLGCHVDVIWNTRRCSGCWLAPTNVHSRCVVILLATAFTDGHLVCALSAYLKGALERCWVQDALQLVHHQLHVVIRRCPNSYVLRTQKICPNNWQRWPFGFDLIICVYGPTTRAHICGQSLEGWDTQTLISQPARSESGGVKKWGASNNNFHLRVMQRRIDSRFCKFTCILHVWPEDSILIELVTSNQHPKK